MTVQSSHNLSPVLMKLSGFLCHVKMTKLLTIILLALPIVLGDWQVDAEEPAKPDFTHSVKTTQKPWTHTKFLNNPEHFQFAIVSDRTGGVRRGVFPKAVKKLNELQPEFVMSVGDLITGGAKQTNESILLKQWQEFNGFIKGFEMPFFYLPGNHDRFQTVNELFEGIALDTEKPSRVWVPETNEELRKAEALNSKPTVATI